MAFEYCWEHHRCTRECRVRALGALFCWQVARHDGFRTREECEACAYRARWASGEISAQEFVERFDRRKEARRARTILVVDDEPNILFALEETVRGRGLQCISACDGEEGLIIARGIRPDLVITDVIMPRLNGFELCSRLKQDPLTRDIPVVLVTVRATDRDHRQGDDCGADAYLVKPFQMHDLEDAIARFVPPLP